MQINPYLHFNGNCAEAFKLYANVLHGEITMMMTYADAPPEMKVDDAMRAKVMHVHMKAGATDLMGADSPPQMSETVSGFSVSIVLRDQAEAERIFTALSAGGEVRMPLQETFWAERFGMLKDRFGTPWMVNCEKTS